VNSQIEYIYDPFNRRLSKKTDEEEVRYFYIDQNEVGAVNANGEIIELRVLGQGMGAEIGAAIAVELHGNVHVPIHDHCGNCVSLVDLEGNCEENYRYSAFGQEQLSTPAINPWRYSSKRGDPETGFVYFGERYYSPKMCRWITVDPIGFEGGSNLYTFLNNNPLNLADFYGLYPEKFSDLHFSLEEDMNHFDEGIFARGFGVGAWKGFSDFTGALNNQANLITGFGQMCYNRDFSSLSFGSLDVKNTVGFLGERTGEIAGQVAFMASAVGPIYQLGKLGLQRFVLPNLSRTLTEATGIGPVAIHFYKTASPSKLNLFSPSSLKEGLNRQKNILEIEEKIIEWLGKESRMIKNKAGDSIFISKDSARRIRFDFIKPNPHNNPHVHIEEYIKNEWKGPRIYPVDVPHN